MKGIASRELVIVGAIMGLGVFAMSILQPMLPLYLTSIGVSPEVLGLMFSVAMVGMVVGESSWGWVADRIGLRLPLTMGTIACGLTVVFFAFTYSVPMIFIIFFFWGLVRSALFGPGRGYVGAKAQPLKKATSMAMISVMLAASRSLGALPSGFIADNLGYNAVFFISSGIALGGGLLVLLGFRNIRSNSLNRSDDSQSLSQGPAPRPARSIYRHLAWQCVVAILQFLGLGILMTFLPLLATEVVGVSAVEVGILFTTGGLVAVISGIPMGMLADRIGKKVFMVIGLIVSASAIAGMAFITSFHGLIALVIVRSLGMVMFSPAALGLLSEFVPTERQSTVMGVYGGICENTGLIAGSALGGVLWSTLGYRTTFLAAATSASVGALICLTLVKVRSIDSPSYASPANSNIRGNKT